MTNPKPKSAAERIKELVEGKKPEERIGIVVGMIEPRPVPSKNQRIKKDGTPDKRKGNGGKGNIGRKPKEEVLIERGLHVIAEAHFGEEVDVKIKDPKTGQERVVKKPRLLIQLERLFAQSATSHEAIGKWLDRAMGKPLQPMEHRGDKNAPIHLSVDI